jgi:hypothetical protein
MDAVHQPGHDAAAARLCVEDARAARQPAGWPRHERQDARFEQRENGLPTVFSHHFVEAGVLLIWHPTAPFKAVDDVALHAARSDAVLGEHGHVVGGHRRGQAHGRLCRQDEMLARRMATGSRDH